MTTTFKGINAEIDAQGNCHFKCTFLMGEVETVVEDIIPSESVKDSFVSNSTYLAITSSFSSTALRKLKRYAEQHETTLEIDVVEVLNLQKSMRKAFKAIAEEL